MDQELLQAIEQLKRGDKKGFPIIYENTYKHVYSRAKCMFSEEQDILDLVQEVYLEMYRNIDSLESNESFYAWLKTITFYQGTKMWRKQGKEILTSEEILDEFLSEDISIEAECTNKQDVEIIKDCINRLSDEQKTVILAYYYDNLKVEEIAELLSISVGTVKSRLYLARKKLKSYIDEQEKKQGYALHSFSGATIALALGTFLQQNEEGAKHQKKFLYKSICKELGLNYGSTLGFAKLAELGGGKVLLVVIGAIASVAVVGGIGLAATGLLDSNNNSDAVNGSEGHFFETESIGNGTEFTESTEVQEENQTETEGELVTETESSAYTFTELNQTMYAKSSVNVRDLPCEEGTKLGKLSTAEAVKVIGQCNETSWYRIEYSGGVGYVSNSYLVTEKPSNGANSAETVPDEYSSYYDTNRDGIITDAEIDAHDKRWYGDEPTSDNQRKVLKADLYSIVEIDGGYYMRTWQDDDFLDSMKIIEEHLLSMGYENYGGYGGNLDEEYRWVVVPKDDIRPITHEIIFDKHGNYLRGASTWPLIAEEIYGYDFMAIDDVCWKIVQTEYEDEFVEETEPHDDSTCEICATRYERVFSFEEIKAALGIQ